MIDVIKHVLIQQTCLVSTLSRPSDFHKQESHRFDRVCLVRRPCELIHSLASCRKLIHSLASCRQLIIS